MHLPFDVAIPMTITPNYAELAINIAAIVIGFLSMYLLIRLNRQLGGRIQTALWFFVLGVLANVAAILWSLFFEHTYIVANTTFDAHQLLMTIGMIFFILSTRKFSLLIRN